MVGGSIEFCYTELYECSKIILYDSLHANDIKVSGNTASSIKCKHQVKEPNKWKSHETEDVKLPCKYHLVFKEVLLKKSY